MRSLGLPELVVLQALVGVLYLLPLVAYWRIFKRVGFPAMLSLFMAVPILNVAGLFYLAFADWPAASAER
jgi:hypothetical protein